MSINARAVAETILAVFASTVALTDSGDSMASWRLYVQGRGLNAAERRCANQTLASWIVSENLGEVRVRLKGSPARQAPPPPTARWTQGRKLHATARFAEGWVFADDRGEFGGGLWWRSDGEPTPVLVLHEPTAAVYEEPNGSLLILSGFLHLDVDEGHVYRLSSTTRPFSPALLATLDGYPQAIGVDGPGFLVATNHSVWSLASSGLPVKRTAVDLRRLAPNSVVRAADGSIYVGLSALILRLEDRGTEVGVEWFLPPQCPVDAFATCACGE
jgi:hypothetical protein